MRGEREHCRERHAGSRLPVAPALRRHSLVCTSAAFRFILSADVCTELCKTLLLRFENHSQDVSLPTPK